MSHSMRVLSLMWSAVVVAVVALYLGRQQAAVPRPRPAPPAARSMTTAPAPVVALRPAHVPQGATRAYRGDGRHTGRSPYRGPKKAELAWAYETAGRVTGQAVLDAAGRPYVGSHDGYLHALTADGKPRFRRYLGKAPQDPILRAEERMYATPLVGPDGRLYAGSDGGQFWSFTEDGGTRFKLATDGDVDSGVTLSPAGLLHFASGRHLYAVTPEGEVRWRYEAWGKIYTTPAVAPDGTVYVGSQDDHLHAVGPDGQVRWSFQAGGDVDSSPVVGDDGGVLFGADDRKVYSLSAGGDLRWSREVDGYVRAPLALGLQGEVYVGVYGPRPALVALSVRDGHELWSFPVTVADSVEVGVASGALVDADGNLYFGAHDDHLYSLTAGGSLRWVFRAAGDIDSPPVLREDGTLLFGSDDGHLYALRPGRGSP